MDELVPIARVLRGGRLESEHYGLHVLLEHDRVLASGGDIDRVVFYRSASKPIQALVLVDSGAARQFGLGETELAIAVASHSSTKVQVDAVLALLEKSGVDAGALRCGVHVPLGGLRPLPEKRDHSLTVWNNCSGKHAGMLAAAKVMGAPLDGYLDPAHPVQVQIARDVARLAGIDLADLVVAVDGCSAPTFAVPLRGIARSMLAFTSGAQGSAAQQLTAAWRARPDLIAGPRRFDTVLMEACGARLLSKSGAEGVQLVVDPDAGRALAVKCADGSDRGAHLLALALLERHGLLRTDEARLVRETMKMGVVRDHEGAIVGSVEAVLD